MIFRALYIGYCWSKAIKCSANEEYKKAIYYLEKSESKRRVIDGEYLLLKGFLYGAVGNINESVKLLSHAIRHIEKDKCLNKDEKIYLLLYANQLIDIANGGRGEFTNNEIQLSNVANHYQRIFPI